MGSIQNGFFFPPFMLVQNHPQPTINPQCFMLLLGAHNSHSLLFYRWLFIQGTHPCSTNLTQGMALIFITQIFSAAPLLLLAKQIHSEGGERALLMENKHVNILISH